MAGISMASAWHQYGVSPTRCAPAAACPHREPSQRRGRWWLVGSKGVGPPATRCSNGLNGVPRTYMSPQGRSRLRAGHLRCECA
eukprot:scaffold7478_cov124-Isochrysis_galbana.AAC.4